MGVVYLHSCLQKPPAHSARPPPPMAGPCNGTISHQAKTVVRSKWSLGPSGMDLLGFHIGGRADLGESWEDCCLSFALQALISAPYISELLPI